MERVNNNSSFNHLPIKIDNSRGVTISSKWLKTAIDGHYNRKEFDEKEYVVSYGDFYVASLATKMTPKGVLVSKDTIGKYKTIVDKLRGFEAFSKQRYLLNELDTKFATAFKEYLETHEKLTRNTVGRYITFVRTILLDAQKNGYEVSKQIGDFRGFTVDTPVVTLSFEELEQIKSADIKNERLQIARDWLLIGCYVGQRVSDLLRMNTNMISTQEKSISIFEEAGFRIIETHGYDEELDVPKDVIFSSDVENTILIFSIFEACHPKKLCTYFEIFLPEEFYNQLLLEVKGNPEYSYNGIDINYAGIYRNFSKSTIGRPDFTEVSFILSAQDGITKYMITINNNVGKTIVLRTSNYRS